MKRLLVVCGERRAAAELADGLRGSEVSAVIAADAARALAEAEKGADALIAEPALLSGEEGEALLEIRRREKIPLILLVEKGEEFTVGGFGAEDYVTLPFDAAELAARALLRMGCASPRPREVEVRGLVLDTLRGRVSADGRSLRLTQTEYRILELLCINRGKVFSAEEIYRRVWNEQFAAGGNVVAVHIRHIREKLGDSFRHPTYLRSVWGRGYVVD